MYIKKNDQKKMILGGVALVAVALFFAYTNIPGVKDKVNSYLPFGEKTVETAKTTTTETASGSPYVVVKGQYYYSKTDLNKAYKGVDGDMSADEYNTALRELERKIEDYERARENARKEKINQGKAVIIEIRSNLLGLNNGAYVKQGFSNPDNKDAVARDFVANTASWQTDKKTRITLPGGRSILPTNMTGKEIERAFKSAGVECVIYEITQKDVDKYKELYADSNRFDIKK